MTYCEKIGLRIGDEIEVLQKNRVFSVGERIRLVEDDDSSTPYFENSGGRRMAFALAESRVYGREGEAWKRIGADAQSKQSTHASVSIPSEDSPLQRQEGGDHYKKQAIQPVEYIMANGTPYMEGNVIKYVSRWRDKGGIQDLKKAIHYLEMLIEHEEKQG